MHKDDDILIQEIRNGSKEAFDHLMQNYQNQVFKLAFSFAKNNQTAMDITQNIFLKVYQNLSRFRGKSQFRTWLMRIAFNESLNWVKKDQRYQPQQEMEQTATDAQISVSQEDEYLAQENRTLLLRSLYELNTKHRLAIVLRYFENYSIKDIAKILKCSDGVVKNILFRSLRKLRDNINIIESGEV